MQILMEYEAQAEACIYITLVLVLVLVVTPVVAAVRCEDALCVVKHQLQ